MTIIDDAVDPVGTTGIRIEIPAYVLGGQRRRKFFPEPSTPLGMIRPRDGEETLDDLLIQHGFVPMSQRRLVVISSIDDRRIFSRIINSEGYVNEALCVRHVRVPMRHSVYLTGWYPTVGWIARNTKLLTIPPDWMADASHHRNLIELGGVSVTPNAMARMNRALLPESLASRAEQCGDSDQEEGRP